MQPDMERPQVKRVIKSAEGAKLICKAILSPNWICRCIFVHPPNYVWFLSSDFSSDFYLWFIFHVLSTESRCDTFTDKQEQPWYIITLSYRSYSLEPKWSNFLFKPECPLRLSHIIPFLINLIQLNSAFPKNWKGYFEIQESDYLTPCIIFYRYRFIK